MEKLNISSVGQRPTQYDNRKSNLHSSERAASLTTPFQGLESLRVYVLQ